MRSDETPQRMTYDHAQWREAIDAFKAADAQSPPPAESVVFAGSSTMTLWKTDEMFANQPVINRGFGGSVIPDVLHYLDEVVLSYAPRTVVFYSGDNDVASGQPAAYVEADYASFIERTLSALPEANLLMLAIKPSPNRWELWPVIQRVNRALSAMCERDDRLTYLDLRETLLTLNGKPDPTFYADGLHLNDDLYWVWSGHVKAALAAIDAAKAEVKDE